MGRGGAHGQVSSQGGCRVLAFGVAPGGRLGWRDGWVDPLTDDSVSPEAQRHRSQPGS